MISTGSTPVALLVMRHVAVPAIAPATVVALYFAPVLLFGCVNRGLMALAVVLLSALAAFVTVGIGIRERARGGTSSHWWLISSIILTLPLVLVLGPLG